MLVYSVLLKSFLTACSFENCIVQAMRVFSKKSYISLESFSSRNISTSTSKTVIFKILLAFDYEQSLKSKNLLST